jgi:hypothetical protein
VLRAPTAVEQQDIVAAQLAQEKRLRPVAVEVTKDDVVPHSDRNGWLARLRETFGTASTSFALQQLNLLADAVEENRINSALAMLAIQMAATHAAAMKLLGRVQRAEQIPQFEANGNLAVKLLRTSAAQMELLAKLRRGREQTVRVEHVHVHAGGQAVVGNVNTPLGQAGGGVQIENSEQPYETEQKARAIALAPGSPVWSANAPRDGLQSEGGER